MNATLPMRSFFLPPTIAIVFAVSSFAAEPGDYLPLKVGHEWITDADLISPKGERSLATGKRKVEAKVERGGKTYFRTRTKLEGAPTPMDFTKLVRKDSAGLYTIAEAIKDSKEQKEIVLPLKAGQKWETTWGTTTFTNTVVGLESITVAGLTYENCFHIHTEASDKSYQEDYWEAPKVGNVKSVVVYPDGSKMTLTLREFRPGK